MTDVLLINMPFSNLRSPSIALGLLKGSLARVGVESTILNFHLRFAELVGQHVYGAVEAKTNSEHLVGEWIFSQSLFQRDEHDLEAFVDQILKGTRPDLRETPLYHPTLFKELVQAISIIRPKVDDFLTECLLEILAHEPRLIGFTSVFEQHLASLSLAKLIKEARPGCFITFGGSNCEGEMGAETSRQFEFVDAVVSGEGEAVFPQIVNAVLESRPLPLLSGVFTRQARRLNLAGQSAQNTAVIENLDTLPIPDYDDYFEQLARSSVKLTSRPVLLFESSRGCWWGEKQHCTFCGLNGTTMAYRSKSAQRALDEILNLTGRYPDCNVNAVDNILDMKYFNSFLATLANTKHEFGLFYEVKANLRKSQLKMLRAAGVDTIQPGIESFSDNVLRIMRKGVTALQNIQLLKWCAELGLTPSYNIIWGFPGETIHDLNAMIDLIPLITHLHPPLASGVIRVDRFSPNFNQNIELGIGPIVPFPAYGHVYPFESSVLFNLAYFFRPEHDNAVLPQIEINELSDRISTWMELYFQSDLFFIDKQSKLLIWDLRPNALESLIVLDEFARAVYLACDEIKTAKQIVEAWSDKGREPTHEAIIREELDTLVKRKLMINQGPQYLALAYRK